MEYYTDFGLNGMPHWSARHETEFPPPLQAVVDERLRRADGPFRGVSTDGSPRAGLFPRRSTGIDVRPLADAAQAFLAHLSPAQRARASFPLDAAERRQWINVHMHILRHGVLLDGLDPEGRRLALAMLSATLSSRGFAQVRDAMRVNEFVAQYAARPDEFGEWAYYLSVFGEPGDEVWGWQLDGHHVCLNCTVVGDQVVLTPAFMGAEPCRFFDGPLAGTVLFSAEERAGIDLIRSLDDDQQMRAVVRPSIRPEDLPRELKHPFDGRILAGAYQDNAVIPYEGISGADLSEAQRRRLLLLVAAYVGWEPDPHAAVRMADVADHLDETSFSWMGSPDGDEPFYYRVQSPVVLIEFDHHPGVVFDNPVPTRNHIHALMRTPNGNDYGVDLIRQHHDRFDHSHGHHVPR